MLQLLSVCLVPVCLKISAIKSKKGPEENTWGNDEREHVVNYEQMRKKPFPFDMATVRTKSMVLQVVA